MGPDTCRCLGWDNGDGDGALTWVRNTVTGTLLGSRHHVVSLIAANQRRATKTRFFGVCTFLAFVAGLGLDSHDWQLKSCKSGLLLVPTTRQEHHDDSLTIVMRLHV